MTTPAISDEAHWSGIIQDAIDSATDLQEAVPAAEDFASGVLEFLCSVQSYLFENHFITEKQKASVLRCGSGIERWNERR